MSTFRPIHFKKFERFLEHIGCQFVRERGDHRVWDRSDLMRPIIVRAKKSLPIFEIKSNLRTLRVTTEEYLNIIGEL